MKAFCHERHPWLQASLRPRDPTRVLDVLGFQHEVDRFTRILPAVRLEKAVRPRAAVDLLTAEERCNLAVWPEGYEEPESEPNVERSSAGLGEVKVDQAHQTVTVPDRVPRAEVAVADQLLAFETSGAAPPFHSRVWFEVPDRIVVAAEQLGNLLYA